MYFRTSFPPRFLTLLTSLNPIHFHATNIHSTIRKHAVTRQHKETRNGRGSTTSRQYGQFEEVESLRGQPTSLLEGKKPIALLVVGAFTTQERETAFLQRASDGNRFGESGGGLVGDAVPPRDAESGGGGAVLFAPR